MSVSYFIQIPNWHPVKVNELLEAHHFAAGRMKLKNTQMIWAYSKHIPLAETKRIVHIAIYRNKGRMPDADAFYKSVFDSLANLKLIVDDSPRWLDHQATDIHTGKKATIITLRDVE
jgi:Holliday junction resolvase RusA-like endonuclease